MFFGRKSESDHKPEAKPAAPPFPSSPALSPKPIGFETVLGAHSKLEGTLRSEGNIRLDGQFNGTLEISGNVLVGESAKIEADIQAKHISIAGTVRGNVSGQKVQLLRAARVRGDITATVLITEEGAFIDGKVSMPESVLVPPPADEVPVETIVEPPVEPVVEPPVEPPLVVIGVDDSPESTVAPIGNDADSIAEG